MKLNVDKCAVLRCTRSQMPIQYMYTLICNLDVKKLHTYLGVEIDNTMSWSPHTQIVCNRATKVFNFVKQYLGNCPASRKRIAYLTLVRPIMEYAASFWDPFYNTNIYKLKKYREELLDGSYLTTPGIQVLHPYYPLLTYLHYNTNKIHPGYHCFTASLITYCQLTSLHTTKELNSIPETTI